MPDVQATICGVLVKGLRLMASRYDGFDVATGQKFQAGTQIAYAHQSNLTPAQKAAIFPKGKVYPVTVVWPMQQQSQEAPQAENEGAPLTEVNHKSYTPFDPNEHQERILDVLLNTDDHLFIKALAGTGKTSTLVWLVKELVKRDMVKGQKIIYLAFNKSIQEELSVKLAGTGVPAMTTHSFGFAALKRRLGDHIEPKRGMCAQNAFITCLLNDNGLPKTAANMKKAKQLDEWRIKNAVLELVGYIKSWAIFPTRKDVWQFSAEQLAEIENLIAVYEIEFPQVEFTPEDLVKYASRVVIALLPEPGQKIMEVDFDDMLYMPLCLNLPFERYDLVLTDETQDFNLCQQIMLERLIQD